MKRVVIFFFFITALINAQNTYQSHILNALKKNLPETVKKELQEKDTAIYNLKNQPIKIYLNHYLQDKNSLGIKIFPSRFYIFFQKEILKLIEREVAYFLFLPNREWREYSQTEKVSFSKPDYSIVKKNDVLEVINTPGSIKVMQAGDNYNIELTNKEHKKLIISFPGSYTFISGLDRVKLQENLLSKIHKYRFSGIVFNKDTAQLNKTGKLWVHYGTNFLIPQLNNNVYYDEDKKLLYNTKSYPKESISNLLLTDLSREYDKNIKVYYYSYGKKQEFNISLKKLLSYFSNGFEKYFGIEEFKNNYVRGTLILRHPALLYIHLIDLHFKLPSDKKEESITAYFYPFIPQNEVKDFFGTDKKTNR